MGAMQRMWRSAALLTLLAPGCSLLDTSHPNRKDAEAGFLAALAGRAAQDRVVILDVGANAGTWSRRMMRKAANAIGSHGASRLELVMFDPQPRFANELGRLASSYPRATFHPFAAWNRETTLPFFFSAQHEMASLHRASAAHGGRSGAQQPHEVRVRAIDLADYMLRNLSLASAAAVLFKLDIEGAEFSVLPRLLRTGALCHASHVIIEWHLLAQPAADRLASLHLRRAIDLLLTTGCATPPGAAPAVVEHFDFAPNNYGDVPGLAELASKYTAEGVRARFERMKGGKYANWSQHWREMDAESATRRVARTATAGSAFPRLRPSTRVAG